VTTDGAVAVGLLQCPNIVSVTYSVDKVQNLSVVFPCNYLCVAIYLLLLLLQTVPCVPYEIPIYNL
jgi:hypothetical protein